jgi:signal transduction histidine kinase
MKLLSKYNQANIVATIIVFIIGGLCYYFILHFVLIKQLDKDLKIEEQEIVDYVKTNNSLPQATSFKDQNIAFEFTAAPVVREVLSVDILNDKDNEYETIRRLVFPVSLSGKYYKASVSKSLQETEDLVQLIATITLAMVILLLLVLFIINRFVFNKLWVPFNNTLNELKQFNLSSGKLLNLGESSINEFKELNNAVAVMSSRVVKEYESVKSFTENASHEIQTPLAIINSKLDVLIQDESLSEFQMKQLQAVYDALNRISNLNQSLLLLTKMENNQFLEKENISMDGLIKDKLVQFEELVQDKNLVMTKDIQPVNITGNRQLLDILVSNLLNNAIRYNTPGGSLSVMLNAQCFSISNTSFLPALDEERVFERFYRHADTKQEGNGLGLSIVKQVCSIAGYAIRYTFLHNRHEFKIVFNTI